ncbi:MAG: hypothetical protein GY807_25000 [Gammaproteobacteria bacterium]|nr:hypothetical protein [Gammaproteobacteria bacterium]
MSTSFKAKVRMYRQGIGDCLLVSLPRSESDIPFKMLIDCGVVLGTPDATGVMTGIVNSLQNATGGNTDDGTKGVIDLLVITHEHWDHVSAFNQVPDWSDRFEVKTVWTGWTENPDDEQAKRLDKAKQHALAALSVASQELGMSGDGNVSTVDEMLAFYGLGSIAALEMFGARATTRDGRDKALALAGDNLLYLEPGGEPLQLQGVDDARIFILGPPRNEKQLKKANPSKSNPETYGFGAGGGGSMALDRLNSAMADNQSPLPSSFRIPLQNARSMPFFQEHYFGGSAQVAKEDDEDGETNKFPEELFADAGWRQLENEWTDVASDLAMKLDSATNNTSLAFAIELEPGGDVLLFPADAQVGNWLSWHDVRWDGSGSHQTATDLLKRTRVYKTGHHGSHNATLRELGLEIMEHPDLIAMVPVYHEVAVKKKWHEMPLNSLMQRLREKAEGRVLRSDQDFPTRPRGTRKSVWSRFQKMVHAGKADEPDRGTYFEVTIE